MHSKRNLVNNGEIKSNLAEYMKLVLSKISADFREKEVEMRKIEDELKKTPIASIQYVYEKIKFTMIQLQSQLNVIKCLREKLTRLQDLWQAILSSASDRESLSHKFDLKSRIVGEKSKDIGQLLSCVKLDLVVNCESVSKIPLSFQVG